MHIHKIFAGELQATAVFPILLKLCENNKDLSRNGFHQVYES